MPDREPTNEQLEAAKAVLLPSLIRDPERGSLSSCVTLIRLALRASLSVGGSITPHPEAREAVGEIVAHISDTAPLSAENIERAVDMILAAGGSPTTTPDGKQAFDSPGVLKDAAPTTTPTASVWIIWDVPSDDDWGASEIPWGYYATEAAAKAALEAHWESHTPRYFGGRAQFEKSYHITEEKVES